MDMPTWLVRVMVKFKRFGAPRFCARQLSRKSARVEKSAGVNALCHAALKLTASCCRMKSFHSHTKLSEPCWYRKLQYWSFPMHHHTSCVQQYSMHRPICTITLRGKKSTTLMASFHKPNSGSDPASLLAASVASLHRVYFIWTQPVDSKMVFFSRTVTIELDNFTSICAFLN